MPSIAANQPARADNGLSRCAILLFKENKLVASGPGATDFLGEESALLLDQPVESLPAPVRHLLLEAISQSREQTATRMELERANGNGRRFHAHAVPLPAANAEDTPRAVLALFEGAEFTEYDFSLRRLERLAGIGILAATLAHEMRNSMVAAKTFVDLLLEKQPDIEVAEVVRREMRRTESLLSQLLRFAGPGKETFAPVRLHTVLDHSLRLLAPQLENQSMRLERRFEAASDLVNGDECALEQAFVNLVFNALDALESQGTLTVKTQTQSSSLVLTFRDTGVGIAPENLEHLFNPFFTTKPSGTGLGLAITRRIVEEHGGTIRVSSQPGLGAEFVISLPLIPPAAR